MALTNVLLNVLSLVLSVNTLIVNNDNNINVVKDYAKINSSEYKEEMVNYDNLTSLFDGVYTECFLSLSFTCLQRRTLMYIEGLNNLSEVTIVGDYIKFVRTNISMDQDIKTEELKQTQWSEELSLKINKAIDLFFDNHILKVNAMGKDISIPTKVEEFVGRKRRKGGGGGGGGHGGGHDGDDGGKKKMMMMAMMCMKMKFMMIVPAMMGMMGMMSFKGMMFSMMSFMISKMMLLMKLLEKKGGGNGGGDGGAWPANGGGGGGAWMPAGGQDFGGGGGGGGGGGYDANGQWQSRSIIERIPENTVRDETNGPIISFVTPVVRYSNINRGKLFALNKNLNAEFAEKDKPKSRKKRGIIDVLQNAYMYWMNKVLGNTIKNKNFQVYPKYKVINGVKYVYYPNRLLHKHKLPKYLDSSNHLKTNEDLIKLASNHIVTNNEEFRPIITAEDFNKGEIVEGPVESRMNRRKFNKFKEDLNDTIEESPWQ